MSRARCWGKSSVLILSARAVPKMNNRPNPRGAGNAQLGRPGTDRDCGGSWPCRPPTWSGSLICTVPLLVQPNYSTYHRIGPRIGTGAMCFTDWAAIHEGCQEYKTSVHRGRRGPHSGRRTWSDCPGLTACRPSGGLSICPAVRSPNHWPRRHLPRSRAVL
jgi:hypothetical protein